MLQEGKPALLENVGEDLDPGLEGILLKQTFTDTTTGMECILLGDTVVEYNTNFKLYIVTDLRNPHFAPEVAVKVSDSATFLKYTRLYILEQYYQLASFVTIHSCFLKMGYWTLLKIHVHQS